MVFDKLLTLNKNDPNTRAKVICYLQLIESIKKPYERSKAFAHLGNCLMIENPLLALHCLQLAIAWGSAPEQVNTLVQKLLSKETIKN